MDITGVHPRMLPITSRKPDPRIMVAAEGVTLEKPKGQSPILKKDLSGITVNARELLTGHMENLLITIKQTSLPWRDIFVPTSPVGMNL